jgi:hypothetical protein
MKQVLSFALMALALNVSAQKINNKLTFQKGQKLELTTQIDKTANQELMGQSMESKVTATMTQVYDVQDATATGTTIEHKVKRLVFDANAMGQSQSFDSEKEGDLNGEMGKVLGKSIKNKYSMTLDPSGKITAVKSDDDNPNAKDDTNAGMVALLTSQLGLPLNVPKAGDVSLFKFLPSNEVSQGQSWVDSSSGNGMNTKMNYTVNTITNDEINLDYIGDSKLKTTQAIMGMDATINTTSKSTGKITLDRKTGLLKKKTAVITSEGTIEAGGQSIPSKEKTTITITVKPA